MTIEKEARDIVERTKNRSRWDMENQTYVPETFPWLEKDIAKALQKKQDRIEELEGYLDKWSVNEYQERIKELESALSYYANMKVVCTHDDPSWCEYCPDGGKRAKKAIGG